MAVYLQVRVMIFFRSKDIYLIRGKKIIGNRLFFDHQRLNLWKYMTLSSA
jgi:hypothetical protein